MKKQSVRPNLGLLAAALSGIAAPAVQAQSIPEVIVTAQRTAAPESKTPVAMSVLTGEQLGRLGLDDAAAIGDRLPNTYLEVGHDGLRMTIRGVTNTDNTEKGDPSAAFMVDGVYVARPQSQTASFYDVDRVEVLRGPQGTLYGRNTTAGVFHVISKAPVPYFEGEAHTEIGTYDSRKLGAMVNVPVNDALALRAAVSANRRDPWLRNMQGTGYHLGMDRDDLAARLSARLALNPGASLLLRYETARDNANGDDNLRDTNFYRGIAEGKPVWTDASTSQRLSNSFVPPNLRPEQGYSHKITHALSAELNWDLGPATLTWLGARRGFAQDYRYNFHQRLTPAYAIGTINDFRGDYSQDSHELRLATTGNGRLSAQGGLFWFHEDADTHYMFRGLQAIGLTPYYNFDITPAASTSRAVFGQATWRVNDVLRATAGARYNRDDKYHAGTIGYQQAPGYNPATDLRALDYAALHTNKTTWRLGLEYDLAPSAMLYAGVATGFKAGGFNDGCAAGETRLGVACNPAAAIPAASLVYQPETVRAIEGGLKTRFWDKRASLNLAAFHYDYRNLQLSAITTRPNGAPVFETSNAGKAVVDGLELDGQAAPTTADRFRYALTLLDAHYVDYLPDGVHSWAGVKLDRTPTRTLSLGYEHRFQLGGGELAAGVDTRASSTYMFGVAAKNMKFWVPGHTQTDLRLTWEPLGARWTLMARVRNLENAVRPTQITNSGMAQASEPRTADLRFDYRF